MIDRTAEREYLEELPSSSKWVNENFVVGDLIGTGSFGRVYAVECRRDRRIYALKEISRGSQPRYIANELKVMSTLGGHKNILSIYASFRERDRVFFVMDYFPHEPLKKLLPIMSITEKLLYIKELFVSLEYLHAHNIIHRDIKPANFLYNRRERRFALIDFGLAHEATGKTSKENDRSGYRTTARRSIALGVLGSATNDPVRRIIDCKCGVDTYCKRCLSRPKKQVNKAGTPGFRPPELLLKFDHQFQTTAIDIWAAGVTLLSLLFKRHPIFRPADDFEALTQIALLLGSEGMRETANEYGVNFQIRDYPGVDMAKLMRCARSGLDCLDEGPADRCERCTRLIHGNVKGRCFCKTGEDATLASMEENERLCIELVYRCLVANPAQRYSAKQLLAMIESQNLVL